jgi:hypothetical protein
MPSLKRDRLLSDLERERLEKRSSLDQHTRATNDVRIKKKLSAWLKSIPDVRLILEKLPDDQIRSVLSDKYIFDVFKSTEIIVDIQGFTPISGRLPDEKWLGHFGEVTDVDIARLWELHRHLARLGFFSGNGGPMVDMEIFEQREKHPDLYTLTAEERRGAERIRHALKTCSEESK